LKTTLSQEQQQTIEEIASRQSNNTFGYFTKEDIYQQIWVFCLENIDKFDPKKGVSLRNYLSIVAKNGMINLYKKTTNSTIKIPDCCVDGDEYHKASCQKWYDYTKFLNRAKDLQKVTEK